MSSRMPQYRGSSSINDIYAILNPQAFIVVPLLWLGCYSRASAFLNHLVSFPGHKMKGIHGVGWPNQMDYGLDIWDTILRFMHHQTLATYFPLTSRGLTQNVSCPDFFQFPIQSDLQCYESHIVDPSISNHRVVTTCTISTILIGNQSNNPTCGEYRCDLEVAYCTLRILSYNHSGFLPRSQGHW